MNGKVVVIVYCLVLCLEALSPWQLYTFMEHPIGLAVDGGTMLILLDGGQEQIIHPGLAATIVVSPCSVTADHIVVHLYEGHKNIARHNLHLGSLTVNLEAHNNAAEERPPLVRVTILYHHENDIRVTAGVWSEEDPITLLYNPTNITIKSRLYEPDDNCPHYRLYYAAKKDKLYVINPSEYVCTNQKFPRRPIYYHSPYNLKGIGVGNGINAYNFCYGDCSKYLGSPYIYKYCP